jgi:hypothetical protein
MSKDDEQVKIYNDEINKILEIFLLEKVKQLNYSKRLKKVA